MIQADLNVILPEIVLSVFAMAALVGTVYTAKDRAAGALTDDEFQRAKDRLLG